MIFFLFLFFIALQALQLFVEKVVVFTQANPVAELGPECSAVFAEYSGLLASQGRLETAATYLKGNSFQYLFAADYPDLFLSLSLFLHVYIHTFSSFSLSFPLPIFLSLFPYI